MPFNDLLDAGQARQFRRENPGRQIELSITPGVVVTADRLLIRSALENLVGNAVKFTGQRPVARIEFGTIPAEPGVICCFVRDNGAGFDPEYGHKLCADDPDDPGGSARAIWPRS